MVKSPSKPGGPGAGRNAHLSDYAAGAIIVQEGAPGSEMFIIDEGEVEIVRNLGEHERVLTTLGPGDFFGEMSVLETRPRSATARAKVACRLLPIDASTFDALLREHPEVGVRMMRKLSARLRGYEEQEERAARVGMALLQQKAGPATPEPAPKVAPAATPAAAGARLEHASGRAIAIVADGEQVIGRPDPVTGAVPEIDLGGLDTERTLSRRHARIIGRDGQYFLREEIGTSNGTWVGSVRLAAGVEHPLADQDRLRFGRLDFVFRLGGSA
jgi:CRP-like cAMP-binding protein